MWTDITKLTGCFPGLQTNATPISFRVLLSVNLIKTVILYGFVVLTIANYALFTNHNAK